MPSLVISSCTSRCPPNAPFSSIPQRLELSFDGTVGDQPHQSTEAHTDEVSLSRPLRAHTLIKCSLIRIQWYCRFAGKGSEGLKGKPSIDRKEKKCQIKVSFLSESDCIASPSPPHSPIIKLMLAFLQSTWAGDFILLAPGCEETDNNTSGRSAGPSAWAGERSGCVCVCARKSVKGNKWEGIYVPWWSLRVCEVTLSW